MKLLPEQFWKLTYSEFVYMMNGFRRTQIREFNLMVKDAWYTATLSRLKQIPALESLLMDVEEKPKQKQSADQMMAMAKMLTLAHGGEIKKT